MSESLGGIVWVVFCCWCTHIYMSNEKKTGWLGYIGDEILPNYMGISKKYDIRIPSLNNQDSMECQQVFFHGSHI